MPTLVVGDLHFKQYEVLPRGSELVAGLGAERVVFCGDLCDDWGATGEWALGSLSLMAGWLREVRASGVRADVLLGHHDLAYVEGVPGAGTIEWLTGEVRERLLSFETVVATVVGDVLVTHAGVTRAWGREWLPGCADAHDACLALADLYADRTCWGALAQAGPARGGWQVPGPLWADASELAADSLPGVRQVVGHTPRRTCARLRADPEVWCCDTFSLFRDGRPIGDGTVLVVDDGKIGVVGEKPT